MTDSGPEDKEDNQCFFEACVGDNVLKTSPVSLMPPNEPADPTEAAVPLLAVSRLFQVQRILPLLANNADTVASSSPPKECDVGKEVDGLPQASNVHGENAEVTTPSKRGSEKRVQKSQVSLQGQKNTMLLQPHLEFPDSPSARSSQRTRPHGIPSPTALTCEEESAKPS